MDEFGSDLAKLVERAGFGDSTAFDEFMRRTSKYLTGFLMHMRIPAADLPDIRQDIYLKVWAHAAKYDRRKSQAHTWLTNIAINTRKDYFREMRVRSIVEFVPVVPEPADEHDLEDFMIGQIDDHSSALHLAGMLSQLGENSPSQLSAVMAKMGNSYTRSAEILGIPSGTVKTRLRYATKELRDMVPPERLNHRVVHMALAILDSNRPTPQVPYVA